MDAFISGCLLAFALLTGACASEPIAQDSSATTGGSGTTLSETQQGSTVSVCAGEPVRIRLEAVPGTGYGWELEAWNRELLRFDGSQPIQLRSEPGAPQLVEFRFQALRTGESPVRLIYRRPWEKDRSPLKEFSVTIRIVGTEEKRAS